MESRTASQAELAACLHRKGFALPLLVQCYGPVLEIAAHAFTATMFAFGQLTGAAFVAFLALAFAMGSLASVSGLLVEELSFNLHPPFSQLALAGPEVAGLPGKPIAGNPPSPRPP